MAPAANPSGEQHEIRHGDQRLVVVEVGGGLRTYDVADGALLDGYGSDEICNGGRGQLLIPWPNRVRDGSFEFGSERHQLGLTEPEAHNAIHGLVRWANWSVARRDDQAVVLQHVLHPQTGWRVDAGSPDRVPAGRRWPDRHHHRHQSQRGSVSVRQRSAPVPDPRHGHGRRAGSPRARAQLPGVRRPRNPDRDPSGGRHRV